TRGRARARASPARNRARRRSPAPSSPRIGRVHARILSKRVEQALEILGQGTLDLERAPRHRMLELEPHRVQRLAPEPLELLAEPLGRLTRKLRTAPVQRITDERRADARHVHANLMRPAGLERDVDVRVRTKTLADRIA